MRQPWRPLLACLAMSGSLLTVVAADAYACSCGNGGPDVAVATGGSVGVVTRLDRGGPEAEFQVEETYGLPMPPRVTGRVDASGGSCYPFVDPGTTVALIFRPELRGWRAAFCGNVPLEDVFLRTEGFPRPESGGPAVAVGVGRFGGAGVVSVDAAGLPVAWGSAEGDSVTACPGGRTVVLTAQDRDPVTDRLRHVLRVVDVDSLAVRRTIALPEAGSAYVEVLRCRDHLARTIDAVAFDYGRRGSHARLLVTAAGVRRAELPGLSDIVAAPAPYGRGVLLATTTGPRPALVAVREDGTRRTVVARTRVRNARLEVSGDGRYAVLYGSRTGRGAVTVLRTFDLATGRRLGTLTNRPELNPVWVGGRLVARAEPGYLRPYTTLVVLDRRLRRIATSPAPQGYGLLVSGTDVVGNTFAKLTLATPGRPAEPRRFGALRLAALHGLALLPGERFAPRTDQ